MTPVPAIAAKGAEWALGSLDPASGAASGAGAVQPGGGFGTMVADQVRQLGALQEQAAGASQALATGTATDTSQAVLAVERARLAMQLAAQLRTKGVEAINDVFHTQV